MFQRTPLLFLGSSCFYVDESHRGSGGALFLKFARAASQYPLYGNSANSIAAQLWKARGAAPIPHSDYELLGVLDWPPVVEEFAVRRGTGNTLARAAGAAAAWFGHVRKLRLPVGQHNELRRLSSVDDVMDILPAEPPIYLTARRDKPYLRWRYFSVRDLSTAVFSFRDRRAQRQTFVAVNERPRGHRGQIRCLSILDVYPKPDPGVLVAIVAALCENYRGRAQMIVLRSMDEACQSALLRAGFRRRDFDSPNGWLLGREGKLPTRDFYFVPGDGDWII